MSVQQGVTEFMLLYNVQETLGNSLTSRPTQTKQTQDFQDHKSFLWHTA